MISKRERMAILAMAALLGISAALQYNDPDPLPWFSIYAGGALACLFALRRPSSCTLPAVVGAAALVWSFSMIRVVPRLVLRDLFRGMKAETPRIEEGREFLGLVIVVSCMAWLVTRALQRRAGGPSADPR